MRRSALACVLVLQGCAGNGNEMVASLYSVSPDQCVMVRDDYMDEIVNPDADFDQLDRLACQMNKCAALDRLLDGEADLSAETVDPETRFRYAPAALGGEDCDALALR